MRNYLRVCVLPIKYVDHWVYVLYHHWGADCPGCTIQGGDTGINFFVAELERILDKRSGKMGVARRQLKRVIPFPEGDD